jgi:hypothetical protein
MHAEHGGLPHERAALRYERAALRYEQAVLRPEEGVLPHEQAVLPHEEARLPRPYAVLPRALASLPDSRGGMPDDLRWLQRELALELCLFVELPSVLGWHRDLCVGHPCEQVGEPSELVRERYPWGEEPSPRVVTLSLLGLHPYEQDALP